MQTVHGRYMSPTGNVQKELVISEDGSFSWTLHSHFETTEGPARATGRVRAADKTVWLDVTSDTGANPDLQLRLFTVEGRRLLVPEAHRERYAETQKLSLGLLELQEGEDSALGPAAQIQAQQQMRALEP